MSVYLTFIKECAIIIYLSHLKQRGDSMRDHRKVRSTLNASSEDFVVVRIAIFVTTVLLATMAVLYKASSTQVESTYVSANDASTIAARYTHGDTTNIDELMFDYGYYPTNKTGDVCSWVCSKDQIWLQVDNSYHVTSVNCQAGADYAIWYETSFTTNNSTRYISYQGHTCEISSQALGALISAATGHYDGFKNV